VVVLHVSRDGRWYFVVSPRYAAWIAREAVALGARDAVFGYGRRTPFLVVTGARVETVFNPELPAVSALRLEMGVRLPLRSDWPADQPLYGQHPYAAHVVDLPLRRADGTLAFAPALVPRAADVRSDYLPYSAANLIAQGFKFLGERYGWGHADGGRDCSGFVSEVYMSLGLQLPRNTGDQGRSEVFDRLALDPAASPAQRRAALAAARPGDLIYVPGHVMMVLGHEHGSTYVIHDTVGIGLRQGDGNYRRLPLNQVAVTPLEPLLDERERPLLESIYAIQRLGPRAERE
jgi:cell wall-associated NlpC family hydrolase